MLAVVQDPLVCYGQFGISAKVVAGVGVAIPTGEVATGHVQADAMPSLEDIAGGPQVDLILVGASRLDQRWGFTVREVAIASADNAVGQVLRVAVWMYIYQACHEIGIGCA